MLTIVTNESAADHPTAPDPRALRALAHPLRWQLIDLIGSETTATATRCAEVLGESVASCSYHLGVLGKYGYIELVPGREGKEKPWQLLLTHIERAADPASRPPGAREVRLFAMTSVAPPVTPPKPTSVRSASWSSTCAGTAAGTPTSSSRCCTA
jgi:hypothetical protein